MTEQQYAEPVSYFAEAENSTQLDRLREQVKTAEASAATETDWVAKTRAEQDAKSIRRELESAELAARQEAQASTQHAARQQEPAAGHYILSDCGGAYLYVNDAPRGEPAQQEFMPVTR